LKFRQINLKWRIKMLIQIHMLQNYAPANLNRDQTGAPKDTMFGGVKRGRVSSQCLKRSIRRSQVFEESFAAGGLLGTRTRRLPKLIDDELALLGVDEIARRNIVKRVPEIGQKDKKAAEVDEPEGDGAVPSSSDDSALETRQLIFIGADEAKRLAAELWRLYQEAGPKAFAKLKINEALPHSLPRSADIAMFGRMTTSAAFEDVHAAVQVAHALATNSLEQEFDYFTAVDDISGETGAGMIGDVEFNSSTYYKYFNIHWEQLLSNLGGDAIAARNAVTALLEAAAIAQPSGKQNSFAANNLPDVIVVEVSRRNVPISYANAFVKPARHRGEKSVMDVSAEMLGDYMSRLDKVYGRSAERAYVATIDLDLPAADNQTSFAKLQEWLGTQVPVGVESYG
jgi:CRISPR system Cascade subunit CasC